MSTAAIICGGRYHRPFRLSCEIAFLEELRDSLGLDLVIEGGATGADTEARFWARNRGIPVKTYHPDWYTYGAVAGPLRNREMLAALQATKGDKAVIAFPGGRGTEDMVLRAIKAGVPVYEYKEEEYAVPSSG